MGARSANPSEPFKQPAAAVVSGYAERLIQEADAAIQRLADLNDSHALHDSRVALRRLRGWFRAFQAELPLKPRHHKAFRRLAHSTNPARDAEVSLEWLTVLERRLEPKAMAGLTRFTAELKAICDENYREVRRDLPRDWHKLARRLRHAASGTGARGKSRPFLASFMASLGAYSRDFDRTLERARRAPTPEHIHALRIAGKRLRYLMETLLPWHPQAEGFMREMKALHDTAGAIQDLQRLIALSEHAFLRQAGSRYRKLLAEYLDTGADHRTLRRPDFTPGLSPLLWICRAAARTQSDYLLRFRKTYLSRKTPTCIRELRLITAALRKRMTVK
ncbi:MAG: CHAD domain-containing protein [Bacillota bacterium]